MCLQVKVHIAFYGHQNTFAMANFMEEDLITLPLVLSNIF